MVYPGEGNKTTRVDLIDTINDTLEKCVKSDEANTFTATNNFQGTTRFTTGNYNITIDNKGLWSYYPITSEMGFTTKGTLQALPLGRTTITGQPAYGISVSPPSTDGTSGGLQLWGIQFSQGDEWSNNALKIVHNELALFGNYQAPCSLTFDNANIVNFRVMPDDGSSANNGQGAIFDFAAWQWDDDSHTTKNDNCPVQILKNDSGSLTGRSLMNMNEMDNRYVTLTNLSSNYYSKSETENNFYNKTASDSRYLKLSSSSAQRINSSLDIYGENVFFGSVSLPASTTGTTGITEPTPNQILTTQDNDYRYAQLKVENTFQEVNNFQKHVNFGSSVETNGTVKVNSGGVVLSADGYVSFNDDGLVTTPSGAKGYPYSEGIPTVLSNGGVYNLGIITEPIDISGVYFDGDDTIIQTCEVWFEQGSTVNAITWMPDLYWIDTANGKAPTWIAKLRYRVAIRKEIDRLIGSVSYSYSI